ncbi:MAG: hypothetical protein Q7V48_03055 [Deltaproteobacteria bacterium]|nr:hypothetical protein [Deltaproteobacteria bacterium]
MSSELAHRKEVGIMLVSLMYQTYGILETIGIHGIMGEKEDKYRDTASRIFLLPSIKKKEVDGIFEIAKSEKN